MHNDESSERRSAGSLPLADHERLLDIAEAEADALAAADAERRRLEGEEYFPAEVVDRMLAGENTSTDDILPLD
ncbi:MAG TPA: hypothetical protein VIT45_04680 [Allosphingosinicella sp.]